MADKRPGVRGPRGPQGTPASGTSKDSTPSGRMTAFQRRSMPALLFLTRLPRWIVVVVLGSLLLLGVVLGGPLTWLGALILAAIGLFVLWLSVLSWPAISPGGRILRLAVVACFFIAAVFKALGRL